jgi:DNA-binding NarL/FixJ family response regulator
LKLLIVESNGLFREAFARAFNNADGVEVIGEIDLLDHASLPAVVEELQPDVVLIGVGVADAETLAAVNRITASGLHPGVVIHGRSLTLPAAVQVAEILRSVDRGFAYLDSDRIQSLDGLVAIARVVAEGKVVIDPQTTKRLLGLINTQAEVMGHLADEDRRLLRLMARGETDEAIADEMGLDLAAVAANVVDIAARLGVDAGSRDARVTTILRYLIATGELPMDYDTGALVQPPTVSRSGPAKPSGDAEDFSLPLDLDEQPDEPRPTFAMPEALDDFDASAPTADPADIVIDIFPGARDERRGAGNAQPNERRAAEPSADSSADAESDIGMRFGQEGVDAFAEFASQGKPEDVEVARRVLEWAAARNLRVRWGSRSSGGSYAVVLELGNLSFWLLTVWAIGMLAQPPFADIERRRDLANRLSLIQGVRIDESGLAGRPPIPLASLREQNDWGLFTNAMDGALDEIRVFFQPTDERQDAAN